MEGENIVKHLQFVDNDGSFTMENPENISYLYFPLASEAGLKSSVTPNLGGDAKISQEAFLLEPVSSENLHNNRSCRNFWCSVDGRGVYSAVGASAEQEAAKFSPVQDKSKLTAGFMWHTIERTSAVFSLRSTVTSFIPKEDNVEIMYAAVQNISQSLQKLTAYAAVPIYGRSADNLRDHRHVTSLLHRIKTTENGVLVCPTMSFDERGHQRNHRIYYVLGCTAKGTAPIRFYPDVESFIGEGGTYTHPRSVYENFPGQPPHSTAEGKEAMGAFRFEEVWLSPGEKAEYIILLGTENQEEDILKVLEKYNTADKVCAELERTKTYWKNKVNVNFCTQQKDFDHLMKWICFQPFLRRMFGCSFLPYHDYGRGGRGFQTSLLILLSHLPEWLHHALAIGILHLAAGI